MIPLRGDGTQSPDVKKAKIPYDDIIHLTFVNDINPLAVWPEGVLALDTRAVLAS